MTGDWQTITESKLWVTELSTGHFSWTRPDPTRRSVDPTRPAIADKKSDPTKSLVQPAARPFPLMYILQLNNYSLIILLLYNKYRRKSINLNVVFEDSYRSRYQGIISKKTIKSEVLNQPMTRPDPPKSGKIVTRPEPTCGSIRSVDNSARS